MNEIDRPASKKSSVLDGILGDWSEVDSEADSEVDSEVELQGVFAKMSRKKPKLAGKR